MKIIAGKFKGKNLNYRERKGLRVTSQKVKEAIFGMASRYVEDAEVLDLYCGYGSLGIEALSRGAKHVTFVDVDGQALKQLAFFLDKLGITGQAELVKRDAIKVIKHQPQEKYDIIVMDPPYHVRCEEKTLEVIDKAKILKPGGICIVEHYSDNPMPEKVGKLSKIKTRVYGDTSVSIFAGADIGAGIEEPPMESTDTEPTIEIHLDDMHSLQETQEVP